MRLVQPYASKRRIGKDNQDPEAVGRDGCASFGLAVRSAKIIAQIHLSGLPILVPNSGGAATDRVPDRCSRSMVDVQHRLDCHIYCQGGQCWTSLPGLMRSQVRLRL
jgi:hypothetical protein